MSNYQKLEQKKEMKACWMSYNAYWSTPYEMNEKYKSIHIDVFNGSTVYLKKDNLNDYDLIVLYSSRFFDDYELEEMKKIATKISNIYNKRVSIGYESSIPYKERKDYNISRIIHFISIKDGILDSDEILLDKSNSLFHSRTLFLDCILSKHNELEMQKVRKK